MKGVKNVARRGVNAIVALGAGLISVWAAAIMFEEGPVAIAFGAAFLVALFALCAAVNYVLFGKATLWNELERELDS